MNQRLDFAAGPGTPISESRFNARHILTWFQEALSPWSQYLRSPVVLASLSLCMLYLTVLSFNAQMITYLLDSGFTALWVSGFRLVSVLFELGATWAAPVLMSKIGPIRSGLWFITWEFTCAAAGVAVFAQEAFSQHIRASVLITSVLFSRIGLWGFDLSIQYLVQEVSLPAPPAPIHQSSLLTCCRRFPPATGHGSPQQKLPYKTYSRCSHLPRR